MSSKITYRERGHGPILILLHGYGGSVQHWEEIANNLSQHFRVVIPNLGHLYMSSDSFKFSEQVTAFGDFIQENFPGQKVNIAGLSYGGAISWGVATDFPELIDRTILINPMVSEPIKLFLPLELRFFFSIPLNLKSVYVMLQTPMGKKFLHRAAEIFRSERAEGPIAVETLTGRKLQFVAHLIHHFAWLLRSANWDLWNKKLNKYRGTCLLIYDRDDQLFDSETYRKFALHIGCDDCVLLSGAGHLAIKTRPELISKYIKDFLHNKAAA